MTASLLAAAATLGPGECVITGLCLVAALPPGPAPGVMFVATGLVLFGARALWKTREGARGR